MDGPLRRPLATISLRCRFLFDGALVGKPRLSPPPSTFCSGFGESSSFLFRRSGIVLGIAEPTRALDRSGVVSHQADDDLHQHALAGAVLADQSDQLGRLDGEARAAEHVDFPAGARFLAESSSLGR